MIAGSLQKLKIAAELSQVDSFTIWDRTSNSFGEQFTARQYVADRFKSIYHRPTRRETIALPSSFSAPASLLVRNEATQDVFALSDIDRYDAAYDELYDNARALHRVSAGEVFREAVQGTGDNLGALVRSSVGILYADLELRTEENYPDAHREQYGNFFLTCPQDPSLVLQDGDYYVFSAGPYSGQEFRIRERYIEAGFQLARAESRAKNTESLTYKLITAAGSYDPTTGVVTPPTTEDRVFSATVTYAKADAGAPPILGRRLTIYVPTGNVGFAFASEGRIVRGSDTYEIRDVSVGADNLQWILEVERVP